LGTIERGIKVEIFYHKTLPAYSLPSKTGSKCGSEETTKAANLGYESVKAKGVVIETVAKWFKWSHPI
jgi:hypothetical protein